MKHTLTFFLSAVAAALVMTGCQKMDKPGLGDYPVDNNPPDGPLKFYAAFDGTSTNPLMNAVDSIRALFPSDNPFTTSDGANGKALTGVNQKFIKYPSFNTWASSSSFTISVWFKKNGQTKNNNGTNGPEYIMSLKASDGYHWSNAVGFLFLEGNNTACAVKSMFVSPSDPANPNSSPSDAWFTWEGGQTIAGLLNDQWHHMALTYDETNSSVKLYIDGVQNPNVKSWGGHGALRLSTTKISEYRIGAGPSSNYASDDWLACTFKGGMDQLRLFGTVLTVSEIQALYNSRL
jgi:hypothetical protein